MMKRFLAIVATLLFAGCSLIRDSSDQGEVAFTVKQSAYALGDTVTATLANYSGERIGHSLCSSHLERRQDITWRFAGPNIYCTRILRILEPGEERLHRIALADSLDLTPGTYRISTGVEVEGKSLTLNTASFDVSATVQQE